MSEPAVPLPRPASLPANPFPGLRPFEPEESDLFFGRRDQIRELLGRIRRNRFLAVVGSSGCGKSSLIRAGLLAALRDGYLVEPGAEWRIAVMRPGNTPVHCLAQALQAPEALGDLYPDAVNLAALEATLRRGSLGLVEAVAEAPLPPRVRLFLLVDQFEELFRFGADPERSQREARVFVKLLLEAVAQRQWPIYIGITMRSDFLGNCAGLPGLPEAINQGLYLVPQMGRAQLRDAVRRPVELYEARITERLVNRLLNDLGDDTDQLPILQHAMMRLWSLWSEGPRDAPLDLEQYEKIGGIAEALSLHVGQVYDDLGPEEQRIAQWMFRKLTQTTRERQVVRQSATLEQIACDAAARVEEVAAVVERFREPGRSFLMPPSNVRLAPETVIDISHESLIRQWKRLSEWAALEARDSRLAREIRDGAALWDEKGREPSFLWQGRRLAEAEEWRKVHPKDLAEREDAFVTEGTRLRDHQILAQREAELPQQALEEAAVRESAITNQRAYVYISAATPDAGFVAELRKALKDASLESWTPDSDLAASGPGFGQAMASIDGADAVLCVISPDAASSSFCREEIDHALKHNKRLIPVLYRDCEPSQVHPALSPLKWVDLRGGRISDDVLDHLFALIGTDFEWVRAHTRLLVRATEWQARGRDASLLLRGRELKEAEGWLAANTPHRLPKVTDDQTAYVMASRKSYSRRVSVVLVFMTLMALVALGLSLFAYMQWREADEQRREAEEAIQKAQQQTDRAQREQSLRVGWSTKRGYAIDPPSSLDPTMATETWVRSVEQSNAANYQLEVPDPEVLKRRAQIRIQYFPPKLSGEKIDPKLFAVTLEAIGFQPVQSKEPVRDTQTNALWFGSEVQTEDVQQIAFAMIRAGINLQYIGCFQDMSGRQKVVQIGGRPRAVNAPSMTVEDVEGGAVIPDCRRAAARPAASAPAGE